MSRTRRSTISPPLSDDESLTVASDSILTCAIRHVREAWENGRAAGAADAVAEDRTRIVDAIVRLVPPGNGLLSKLIDAVRDAE